MSLQARNYKNAIREVGERVREARGFLLGAEDAMVENNPKGAWELLDYAKDRIEGAMVTAKWAQSLFPDEG